VEELLKLVKHPTLIVLLLAGIGITNIANLKLSTDPTVVRPDPYTGQQAKADNAELRAEFLGVIQENRDDIDVLRHKIEQFREEQIRNTLKIKNLMKYQEKQHTGK